MQSETLIFDESVSFDERALAVFHYQSVENKIYKAFIDSLKIDNSSIRSVDKIPFLPISLFKTQKVFSGTGKFDITFTSSGTGGDASTHYVHKTELYIESFMRSFELFYGAVNDYCILALLPSYLERKGSSLVFMCDYLIKKSGHPLSGFYLDDFSMLDETIRLLRQENKRALLIGVTFGLLDFAAAYPQDYSGLTVVETGGMKGRRKELVREELHDLLKKGFHAEAIHSEYGMTELLSQAWSEGNGIYKCPPWMKVLCRDINDPFQLLGAGSTGGVNVIDLANIYSCSFIATQDLGKVTSAGEFEILGRFDNSDLRGCNLMAI